jgi:hypothetical protein
VARVPRRRHAKCVKEPQPPHEEDGAHDAVALPAPSGRQDFFPQTGRRHLHGGAESDVFHQRNLREAAEGVAMHEDRLVAGRDSGQSRAQVHGGRYQAEQRVA